MVQVTYGKLKHVNVIMKHNGLITPNNRFCQLLILNMYHQRELWISKNNVTLPPADLLMHSLIPHLLNC